MSRSRIPVPEKIFLFPFPCYSCRNRLGNSRSRFPRETGRENPGKNRSRRTLVGIEFFATWIDFYGRVIFPKTILSKSLFLLASFPLISLSLRPMRTGKFPDLPLRECLMMTSVLHRFITYLENNEDKTPPICKNEKNGDFQSSQVTFLFF